MVGGSQGASIVRVIIVVLSGIAAPFGVSDVTVRVQVPACDTVEVSTVNVLAA